MRYRLSTINYPLVNLPHTSGSVHWRFHDSPELSLMVSGPSQLAGLPYSNDGGGTYPYAWLLFDRRDVSGKHLFSYHWICGRGWQESGSSGYSKIPPTEWHEEYWILVSHALNILETAQIEFKTDELVANKNFLK